MNEQAAEAVLHGFNVPLNDGEEVEDRFDDYDKLTAEWVRQLDL